MGYGGGESIGGDGGDMYKGKTEPALVSVSDSYSKDKEISVYDSGLSSSPTYTITDYLSGYCPKENVNYFVLRRTFYSRQLF